MLLTASRLSLGYGRSPGSSAQLVIEDLSLSIDRREAIALIGPSGGGKTTLLRAIAGALSPIAGTVVWQSGSESLSWYMPQAPMLIPFRNVLENVIASRELRGIVDSAALQAARDIVCDLGLESAALRLPSELSGGMKKRVALAQALFAKGQLLILDEPFAELDTSSRQRAEKVVRTCIQEAGQTLVFATHDLDSAVAIADRIIIIANDSKGIPPEIKVGEQLDGFNNATVEARRNHFSFATVVGQVQEAMIRAMEVA